ncbi:TIM barrel protein [Oceaniserpentilla sp. 4NH20-0058]|uniref:hydroxypyruvate isomerase family protein n=1 Tax=Oceaniserpentilla sp. 4NH20-0058 TaxID=3127660 RepID=UPI00310212C4
MRLGANLTLLFTEVPLLERFQAAADAGFKTVEIQFPYEENLEALVEAKQQSGVNVCLINVPAADLMSGGEGLACVPGKEAEFEQALQQTLHYAQALGVKRVNVLAGRCLYEGQEAVYLDVFKRNLKKAADFMQPHNILVTFEAVNLKDMPSFLIHNTEQMLSIMAELNHSNIKMQYDIYHMQIMDGNVDETLTHHAEKIGHIQFADVPGRSEPLSGNLNFQRIFNVIEQSHYHGFVSAEYRPSQGNTKESLQWMNTLDLKFLMQIVKQD